MTNRTVIFGGVCLLALSFGMFRLVTWMTEGDFEAVGTFEAKGTRHGDFSIVRPMCQMDGKNASGVRLEVEGGGRVHVVKKLGKPEVVIDVPSTCTGEPSVCQTIVIDPKRCSTYDVVVEETNNTYNKRPVWRGHLRLSCELDPGTLVAALGFEKCV